MYSAFGVEHGEFSKRDDEKPSKGKQIGYGAAGYALGSAAGASAAVGPKKYGQAWKNIGPTVRRDQARQAAGKGKLTKTQRAKGLYGSTKVANRAARGGLAGGVAGLAGGVALARRKKD